MRSILAVLVVGAVVVGCSFAPRSPTDLTVYHGTGNTQITRVVSGETVVQPLGQRELALTVPRDSKVCFTVINGNAPLFSYSLKSVVDSTQPKPPAFGGIVELLQTTLTGRDAGVASANLSASGAQRAVPRMDRMKDVPKTPDKDSLEEMYSDYTDKINQLDADVSDARRAIIASAEPESIEPTTLVVRSDERKGLGYAKQVIAELGQDQSPGRFGDPKLDQTLKGWKTNAESKFGGKPKDYIQKVIDLLDQRAATVMAARNAIRTTYASASTTYHECQKVGGGTTTISLAIQAKDTTQFGKSRDTGTPIVLTARSEYQRELLEILPIGFLTFPSNRTGFGIENGVVVENVKYAQDVAFRAGLMAVSSPLRFGEIDEYAVGFGIGTGLVGDGKPALSEFTVGALGSWRDWLRVGLGYGYSQGPKALKNGAKLGEALPLTNENKKLEDFIDTQPTRSFFLLFTITGLKLTK